MSAEVVAALDEFIYKYLISQGIPANQLTYKGYGSSYPAFSNKYKTGRANNRRIEVRILQKRDFGTTNLVDESAYKEQYKTAKELKFDTKNTLKVNDRIVLDRLSFAPNSVVISDSLNPDLMQIMRLLTIFNSLEVEVGGYTDNSGIKEKNDSLSEARALSVFLYLIKKAAETNSFLVE